MDAVMLSIHLYPSQLLNESRILREVRTLSRLGLFDRIDLVGMGGKGLEENEDIGSQIWVRRLGVRREDAGLIGKVAGALKWSLMAHRKYRKALFACINCHSVTTLPLGCALKWVTGARLIYDGHELETETNGLRGIRKSGTKIVGRALIRYVDYSSFVGRAIERLVSRSVHTHQYYCRL